MRVNVTSAYTVEVLKNKFRNGLINNFSGSATESEIISQLRRNDSITESKEADHVREKVTRPSEAQDDHLYKRQRRDEFEYPTEIKSSGQEQMSSEHSRKLTPQLLRGSKISYLATKNLTHFFQMHHLTVQPHWRMKKRKTTDTVILIMSTKR
uniref:Uncharacterized protein n=1 Tax=Rhizophagus irregularis (strain DAOM 181602 / DAOM 197198 / MUCL 43194) TaxID=747089 RepID=U9ST58_RHIID